MGEDYSTSPSTPRPNIPTFPYDVNRNIKERNERMFRQDMEQMQQQIQDRNRNISFDEFEPQRAPVVLPRTYHYLRGTKYYRNAFSEMQKMATGEIPFS